MSFRHPGSMKEGKEQPETEETKKWAGALENYSLADKDDKTELSVSVDIVEEYIDYMNQTFPKALDRVKTLSE